MGAMTHTQTTLTKTPVHPVLTNRTEYLLRDGPEPHKIRAEAIRKAHPEVKELMGTEPLTKFVAVSVVVAAFFCAYLTKDLSGGWWLLATYAISGTFQGNLFLAIHEIAHNLAFKSLVANRLLAIFCNLPLMLPYAYTFKPFHMAHHKSQGEDGVDTDIPSKWEAKLTSNFVGKFCWLFCQIFAYAIRPGMIKPDLIPWDRWLVLNWVVQFSFDAVVVYFWGPWPILYFLCGMLWAASFHPTAGHFISEHYVLDWGSQPAETPPETYSYYGPLNLIAWNVGYHNEHHDFPAIPWTRLPRLREIAPEFYDHLPQTNSWMGTTLTYLFSSMNGFNRVKQFRSVQSQDGKKSM
eukprot:TRINITY_DN189_c0_g1_i13.p1 TRINITY_DN189_c0_g1~~TRINITY_DN189_c0_g1_i13.p1  ORF type:complete len:350 (+),score=47.29 TRINITY_DN189_c0_g1_i13:219-1268(+)